jgi:hypothetical protein
VLSRADQGKSAGIGAALAGEGSARESAVYDNEAQFRFYSRWRYLVQAGPAERVE